MTNIKPAITVSVEASIRASNGIEVTIDSRTVRLRQPGARGGNGTIIEVPLSDWDAVNAGVFEVRQAIARANTFVQEASAVLK